MKANPESHRARLQRLAIRAMEARGLLAHFDRRVQAEVEQLKPVTLPEADGRRDLRDLSWASIDNDDSRDLDQLTVAEEITGGTGGTARVLVAIADVDALVKPDSAIDTHAGHNTTSVYTAAQVFPMLPTRLCYDLTSLNEGEDRPAIVAELELNDEGDLLRADIYTAVVRNHAKLAYDVVGAWLAGEGPPPEALASRNDLAANLRRQDVIAQQVRRQRHRHGALGLQTIEWRPRFKDEQVIDLAVDRKNRAKELIENLMIAANVAMAEFLKARELPSLRRVVRVPSRWERIVHLAEELGATLPAKPDPRALEEFLRNEQERDPLRFPDLSLSVVKLMGSGEYVVERPGEESAGHFGLAVRNYAHSTAPNRRYPDLITQRLVKAALKGEPSPYDADTLEALVRYCTTKEDDANKVERQVAKSAAALLLEGRIGECFDGLVTGASPKGTWVRVLEPPVEGKVVAGAEGVDVGDRVRVELTRVDVERGYIDFRRCTR